ncbi:MAG: DUF4837 family protein [Bacteroidota bacterium]
MNIRKLLFAVIALFLLSSCSDSSEGDKKEDRILPSSSGKINEMVVVMKHDLWKGKVGNEVRSIFGQEIDGLPQPEPLYRVAHVAPSDFNSVFKAARNIIIVELKESDKASLSINSKVYAQPQIIEKLSANNEETLIKALRKYKEELVDSFHKQDIKSVQQRFKRIAHYDIPNIEEKGISLILPKSYSKVEVADNFWWYRSDIKEGKHYPTLNFMLYITPLNSDLDLSGQSIVAIRDSIARKYVGGAIDGSYMQTESRPEYAPIMKNVIVDDKVAIETRGLWMVEGDFMGGPFINYTIFDEVNKRIITAEGFVYAAGTKKRNYIFEMEAIIKSLKLK